ncbi:MAG: polysaccharide biosynthesis C-terminal domain-containing protein, partial [Clostridia bacterium]|nr:polysaccharide biosynthesis C-terminal domain-containing protein [Clostridia bacterium]
MSKTVDKQYLFETAPIPKAVASLSTPTVIASLVMLLYTLADTFFVGLLNDPIATAAVALAAPIILAFNAVNNLFGIGGSSLVSRSLGAKDFVTLRRASSFSFYCSVICGLLYGLICTVGIVPLLKLLGTTDETFGATRDYMYWAISLGAMPAILNVVMSYLIRAEGATTHAGIGTMSGCILNIILDPLFILPAGFNMGAAGAGCATMISNCVACLYFFGYLFIRRRKTALSLSPKDFSFRHGIPKKICSV